MALLLLAGALAVALLAGTASGATQTVWFVTSDAENDVLALARQALPAASVRHGTLDQTLA